MTLPGRRPRPGSLNPLAIVERRIVEVFTRMGYQVVEGPEIEDDWHNFEALNIPPDHPARTMKDSLYVDIPGRLLRTETSAAQIRTMETQDPPIHIVSPGRVYRQETPDATHLPVFHQVECLAVDEGISFADLKGTLETFARAMFGGDRKVRLNPDYFPFVEPGAQVAVSCFICDGVGCRTCGNGWIELLGAGHGPSQGARELRVRQRALHGVRVRPRDRAGRDDPVRRTGHAAVRRGRRAVPRAVPGRRMRIVRSWLLECCPVDLSAEDLAELLTSKGAEVERIERPWDGLDGVVVAKVLEVRDHPNSDKLCLARVSTGSSEREVVVGVRNMVAGDLVPLAGPGARVPALPGRAHRARDPRCGVRGHALLADGAGHRTDP